MIRGARTLLGVGWYGKHLPYDRETSHLMGFWRYWSVTKMGNCATKGVRCVSMRALRETQVSGWLKGLAGCGKVWCMEPYDEGLLAHNGGWDYEWWIDPPRCCKCGGLGYLKVGGLPEQCPGCADDGIERGYGHDAHSAGAERPLSV